MFFLNCFFPISISFNEERCSIVLMQPASYAIGIFFMLCVIPTTSLLLACICSRCVYAPSDQIAWVSISTLILYIFFLSKWPHDYFSLENNRSGHAHSINWTHCCGNHNRTVDAIKFKRSCVCNCRFFNNGNFSCK